MLPNSKTEPLIDRCEDDGHHDDNMNNTGRELVTPLICEQNTRNRVAFDLPSESETEPETSEDERGGAYNVIDDTMSISIAGSSKHYCDPANHTGTVGLLGGISIAVNTLTGPGMLDLPATFQRSGFIPTTVTIIILCGLTSLCSLHMANLISKIPHNRSFQKEVEYSEAFKILGGYKWFIITQILFFLCIMFQLVASIVDTAQVVDEFMGYYFKEAYSLQFFVGSARWVAWDQNACLHSDDVSADMSNDVNFSCIPFDRTTDSSLILSVGYILSALIFIPMSVLDLKESIVWQILSFIVLLVISVQFMVAFCSQDFNVENMSWWGDSYSHLFGVVMFNFTVVIAIPAWLYEKSPDVSVHTVIHSSSVISATLYIMVGSLGAMSMPHVAENMLESMTSGSLGEITQMTSSLFAFFIIGLGIPLFSVVARLNLVGSGLCSERTGNILAVYVPWILSWMLYQGDAIKELISWGGVICISFVCFLAPLSMSLKVAQNSRVKGSINVFNGLLRTRKEEIKGLQILLVLAVISVTVSIAGLGLSEFWYHGNN